MAQGTADELAVRLMAIDAEIVTEVADQIACCAAWWQAARQMYRQGVRYVLIEKSTSLRAPDLERFSTGPTPLVRTPRDRSLLGIYYYRNNRVGRIVYDHAPYTLYRLDPRRLSSSQTETPSASGSWQKSRKRHQTGIERPSAPAAPIPKHEASQNAGSGNRSSARRASPCRPTIPAASMSGQRQRSSTQ